MDTVVNAKPDMFRKMPTNAKVCRVSYSHLLCTNFEASIFRVFQSLRILYFLKISTNAKQILTDAHRFVQMSMEATTVTAILDSRWMTTEKPVLKVGNYFI